MHRYPLPLALLLVLGFSAFGTTVSASGTKEVEMESLHAEAARLAGQLGGTLRNDLMAAMQSGGPLNAINVCREKAGPAAYGLADTNPGWTIGRTSLRIRNLANSPDEWESKVLRQFEQRVQAGEDPSGLEQIDIVNNGNQRQFRYMKAIPAAEMCMLCHGENLAPELKDRIGSLYPGDRATGYKPGELRGAFTLTRQLE